jgi:superoxide dismutase, Fe-Mn family
MVPLMPLPYPEAALAPHISAKTLKLHHGAHHKGYVDKTNDAIRGTALADAPLNAIVMSDEAASDEALFNSAAQAWNHGFYWHSLTPVDSRPSHHLEAAVIRDFGSIHALRAKLAEEAEAHFASGWAWLVADGATLSITTTHDAETIITGSAIPLLCVDVWEHAYYLDHQNERGAYLKAVTDELLNWDFASENYDRGTAWVYPEE